MTPLSIFGWSIPIDAVERSQASFIAAPNNQIFCPAPDSGLRVRSWTFRTCPISKEDKEILVGLTTSDAFDSVPLSAPEIGIQGRRGLTTQAPTDVINVQAGPVATEPQLGVQSLGTDLIYQCALGARDSWTLFHAYDAAGGGPYDFQGLNSDSLSSVDGVAAPYTGPLNVDVPNNAFTWADGFGFVADIALFKFATTQEFLDAVTAWMAAGNVISNAPQLSAESDLFFCDDVVCVIPNGGTTAERISSPQALYIVEFTLTECRAC